MTTLVRLGPRPVRLPELYLTLPARADRAVASQPVTEPRAWDRAMVERIRAGDDTALGAVYDRYGAAVNGIAVQLLGADQARDVTQDVFVHLWRHPERYDADRGGLRGFLSVVARRRAIDAIRSGQRRQAREQRSRTARPSVERAVEDVALAGVCADRVRAAIERLPAEQREAIQLAYFNGLTFRDVARVTGTAEGTAKSRLRLALGRLAKELADQRDLVEDMAWA